ncbi:MAG TPA: hypothetical protein VGJ20_13885 [Xanthobacteraceae bacterium]
MNNGVRDVASFHIAISVMFVPERSTRALKLNAGPRQQNFQH